MNLTGNPFFFSLTTCSLDLEVPTPIWLTPFLQQVINNWQVLFNGKKGARQKESCHPLRPGAPPLLFPPPRVPVALQADLLAPGSALQPGEAARRIDRRN